MSFSMGHRIDKRTPSHVTLSIFVGRREGLRGLSGQLVLTVEEYDWLHDEGRLGDFMYAREKLT
jgi:hypothetical protein